MNITTDTVEEFKDRMHITHSAEDGNLKHMLSFSMSAIKSECGDFDLESDAVADQQAKELVFERTRYAYNDALEYFNNNFLSDIHNVGFALMQKDDVDASE